MTYKVKIKEINRLNENLTSPRMYIRRINIGYDNMNFAFLLLLDDLTWLTYFHSVPTLGCYIRRYRKNFIIPVISCFPIVLEG